MIHFFAGLAFVGVATRFGRRASLGGYGSSRSELPRTSPGDLGLGSARRGWDAARAKQQRYTTKTYKPGPFDSWTDEELHEKAMNLIMGQNRDYTDGAWYDIDRAYTIANWARRDASTCFAIKSHIERAVPSINLAKRIYDTGRITRFGSFGNAAIDFDMISQRMREAIDAYNAACGSYGAPYKGPTFP